MTSDRDRPGPDPPPSPTTTAPSAKERFRATDAYRADREWHRYEGTPQRDLFRQLRVRFLHRHRVDGGWAVDVGAGPGRFTPFVGGPSSRRVAMDLGREMLGEIPIRLRAYPRESVIAIERVRADAMRPPFPPGSFREVAVLGNSLGFAGAEAERTLASCEALVAPGGTLVVEIAPGPGERSRYLRRLPPSAVARLLESPTAAVLPRVHREGFDAESPRHAERSFRRWTVPQLVDRWRARGWSPAEVLSVAPCLGADNERAEAIARSPRAWGHLLEIEESVGRREERWPGAAAVLLAARNEPLKATH